MAKKSRTDGPSVTVLALARTVRDSLGEYRVYVDRGSPGWAPSSTRHLGMALTWTEIYTYHRWRDALPPLGMRSLARNGWELIRVRLEEIGPEGDGRPIPDEMAEAAERQIKAEEAEKNRNKNRRANKSTGPENAWE